jgi:hypothetical protein
MMVASTYSDTALNSKDMTLTDIWMEDHCITKPPPTDENKEGNSRHASVPHMGFKLMMLTEWLNKACLSQVYLIMDNRSHTTYINCTKY